MNKLGTLKNFLYFWVSLTGFSAFLGYLLTNLYQWGEDFCAKITFF